MTKTRTFNDNSHSLKRRERRITNDGHNGLVSIGSSRLHGCSAVEEEGPHASTRFDDSCEISYFFFLFPIGSAPFAKSVEKLGFPNILGRKNSLKISTK